MTEETANTENNDPVLSIVMRVSEINTVLAGLQELPFKVVDPLLKSIIAQAQAQLGQAVPIEQEVA